MGTRGLEIVRFHRRYYIRYHQYDSYYEGLGAHIVARIPADRDEYLSTLCGVSMQHRLDVLMLCRMARVDAGPFRIDGA